VFPLFTHFTTAVMTEFKKVCRKVEEVEKKISEIEEEEKILQKKFEECEHVLAILDDLELQTSLARFKRRMGEKDPITEAPRYGPQMMEKVQALLEKASSLRDQFFGSLWPPIQAAYETLKKEEEEKKAKAEELARKQAEEEEIRIQQQAQEGLDELIRSKRKEEAEKEQMQAALAEQAQLAREAKENAQRAEEEAKQLAREAMEKELYSVPVGEQGVAQALQRLQVATSGPNSKEYKEAMKALAQMYGGMVSKPEDARFRKIRLSNQLFQSQIGQYDGGKQVFTGSGFRLIEEEEENFLFLKEPDLMSDFEGWSEWFNLLKVAKDMISDCI